jgi:hypothetical protein
MVSKYSATLKTLPHGMAVEGRIAAGNMVLKLALDISQQA